VIKLALKQTFQERNNQEMFLFAFINHVQKVYPPYIFRFQKSKTIEEKQNSKEYFILDDSLIVSFKHYELKISFVFLFLFCT
jgi:hypothetical protein